MKSFRSGDNAGDDVVHDSRGREVPASVLRLRSAVLDRAIGRVLEDVREPVLVTVRPQPQAPVIPHAPGPAPTAA